MGTVTAAAGEADPGGGGGRVAGDPPGAGVDHGPAAASGGGGHSEAQGRRASRDQLGPQAGLWVRRLVCDFQSQGAGIGLGRGWRSKGKQPREHGGRGGTLEEGSRGGRGPQGLPGAGRGGVPFRLYPPQGYREVTAVTGIGSGG